MHQLNVLVIKQIVKTMDIKDTIKAELLIKQRQEIIKFLEPNSEGEFPSITKLESYIAIGNRKNIRNISKRLEKKLKQILKEEQEMLELEIKAL